MPSLDKRVFAEIVIDLPQLGDHIGDQGRAAVRPSEIKVKQGRVGDAEIVEKPPEVADISSAQRHDRHEGWIKLNAHSFSNPRNHKPLGVALAENDEAGEVKLRVGPDGEADILAGFFICPPVA